MQATRAIWIYPQEHGEHARDWEQATTALSPVVARILRSRGIGAEDLADFLHPDLARCHDPFLLLGMRAAIDRLLRARAANEMVAVYGDFDVDGMTATALMVQALTIAGIRAIPYIPNRQSEGSGLQAVAIESLAARGATLLITVDCGISSVVEVSLAAEAGIEVIVTDHHGPPDQLPPAVAIIDPLQPGCSYPFKDLAGVGVAFKVAQALLHAVSLAARERDLLDLVAIGTVADMVPLLGENRILVYHGLRSVNETRRPGVRALIDHSGLQPRSITALDIGYRLSPRLNAAGRLDHTSLGYTLLMANQYQEVDRYVRSIEGTYAERQQLVQMALAAAHDQLAGQPLWEKEHLLVVTIEPGASAVIGLLAGKLVEEFGKPVMVLRIGEEETRGSLRGTHAFSMLDALREQAELLRRYGGHHLAAGFTADPRHVPALIERLRAMARRTLDDAASRPRLRIDAEVSPKQLTWQLHDGLQALEPCGAGNPLPLFLCKRVRLIEYRRMGNDHLRMVVARGSQQATAIAFRRGDLAHYLRRNMEIDLVFNLEVNEWNGERTLQLRVRDMAFEPAYHFGLDQPTMIRP